LAVVGKPLVLLAHGKVLPNVHVLLNGEEVHVPSVVGEELHPNERVRIFQALKGLYELGFERHILLCPPQLAAGKSLLGGGPIVD
jgi:hypothetical protein